MERLKDYAAQLRDKMGSERQAARLMGISNTAFNEWVTGKSYPRGHHINNLALFLGVDAPYLHALKQAEKALADDKLPPEKKRQIVEMWDRATKRLREAAVMAAMAIGAASFGAPSPAQATSHIPNCGHDASGIRIVRKRRAPRWWEARPA
jgi:transcriptional regulator with XRE-family HTH domain